jgi:hypothetical protein
VITTLPEFALLPRLLVTVTGPVQPEEGVVMLMVVMVPPPPIPLTVGVPEPVHVGFHA